MTRTPPNSVSAWEIMSTTGWQGNEANAAALAKVNADLSSGNQALIDEDKAMFADFANIEAIHDDLHAAIGGTVAFGGGTMSNPAISAFDPSFWLLHSLIEHWYCLWQVSLQILYCWRSWISGVQSCRQTLNLTDAYITIPSVLIPMITGATLKVSTN
jgi:hypothetical protein